MPREQATELTIKSLGPQHGPSAPIDKRSDLPRGESTVDTLQEVRKSLVAGIAGRKVLTVGDAALAEEEVAKRIQARNPGMTWKVAKQQASNLSEDTSLLQPEERDVMLGFIRLGDRLQPNPPAAPIEKAFMEQRVGGRSHVVLTRMAEAEATASVIPIESAYSRVAKQNGFLFELACRDDQRTVSELVADVRKRAGAFELLETIQKYLVSE
jgi:hypothetical protein